MSTTVYQTTARPRGRKDTDQVPAELDGPSSRASSQASQKLAKTVSRTLDEFQSTKSRPHSPAFFWHRNKGIDGAPQPSPVLPAQSVPNEDTTVHHRPQSMSLMPSPTSIEGVSIPGAFPAPISDQHRVSMPPANTLARVMSQSQAKGRRSPSRSRTRSLTQSSVARMQPTVVDASEDETSRTATTARSSATSLDLKSGHNSEVGVREAEQAPPPPPSHSPPKPPPVNFATPGVRASEPPVASTPRQSNSRAGSYTYSSTPQHMYQPPPSSFPSSSPRQYTADQATPGQQNVSLPAISPPQSPMLLHQPIYSDQAPAPYYGYPPQILPGQSATSNFYGEMQHLPSPPLTSNFNDQSRSLNSVAGDDSQRDWAKLTSVLPELNRLLSKYEDKKGQSSSRDSFAAQMDQHRTHEVASLRVELEANKSEYEKVIQKLVTESFELKREIENRDKTIATLQTSVTDLMGEQEKGFATQAKHKELSAQYSELQKKHGAQEKVAQQAASEVESMRLAQDKLQKKLEEVSSDAKFYRSECATWKSRYQEAAATSDQARLANEDLMAARMKLESGLDDMRRKSQVREEKHQAEIKSVRREHEAILEAKEKEHMALIGDQKASLGSVQLELAGLVDRHNRQRKDLDNSRAQVSSLEKKLDSKTRDREEQSARHRQQLESQLASLTSQRQKELDTQKQDHDKALYDLRKSHETKILRIGDDHAAEVKKIQSELHNQRATHEAHKRETADLRTRHGELASVMVSWRQRQDEWQAEQNKINKILEAFNTGRKGK